MLERKVHQHAGTHPERVEPVAEVIRTLRRDHPRWSYQLVHDNMCAVARESPSSDGCRGTPTVCRYMRSHGLAKALKPRRHEREPGFVPRERRLFEVKHVHGLWHADFHVGKRKVVTSSGNPSP